MVSTHTPERAVLGGDAPIGSLAPVRAPPGFVEQPRQFDTHALHTQGPPPPGGGKGDRPTTSPKMTHHNVNPQSGLFETTRTNKRLCVAYNAGTCLSNGNSIFCPTTGELHICSKCLQQGHPAINCGRAHPVPQPSRASWYEKGKGKGKSQKGGKGDKGGKGKPQKGGWAW